MKKNRLLLVVLIFAAVTLSCQVGTWITGDNSINPNPASTDAEVVFEPTPAGTMTLPPVSSSLQDMEQLQSPNHINLQIREFQQEIILTD